MECGRNQLALDATALELGLRLVTACMGGNTGMLCMSACTAMWCMTVECCIRSAARSTVAHIGYQAEKQAARMLGTKQCRLV
jgi:hypothetical protein